MDRLERVLKEMRQEAEMVQRNARESFAFGDQMKGAVAAAVADHLWYWADRVERAVLKASQSKRR